MPDKVFCSECSRFRTLFRGLHQECVLDKHCGYWELVRTPVREERVWIQTRTFLDRNKHNDCKAYLPK